VRITSELWVSAYLRRMSATGTFGAVVRHGDDRAGAILIKVSLPDRTARLYGPAPAGLAAGTTRDGDDDRRFEAKLGGRTLPDAEVEAAIAREIGYDGDLWVVEIECADGDPRLDDRLA
jgi:hypothetical protein